MAYKSLIDYYGGGMVRPSRGYQLGGRIASAGRQREYSGEIRNLIGLGEQAAERREKVGGNWLRKLAVGTAGTVLGGPMGGGAALAFDQAAREKKFKKTEFGGGKYAQPLRERFGKQEEAFEEKGLARVGIAGIEGYLGGKSGGTFGKTAGFLKGLPTDIGMIKGAMAGKGGASFLEAAKGVGWGDVPSMLGGKSSLIGSLLPSLAPKAMNAPSLYEQSDAAMQAAELRAGKAAGMIANTTDEQDFQQWAGMTGAPAVAEQTVAPTQAAVTQPLTSRERGDILGNEYMERVRAEEAGRQEPEMQGEQDIYQLPPVDVVGSSPEPEIDPLAWSPTDWYDEPEDEYPSYGLPSQQPPAWAGGLRGGGLVDYMMPQSYQEGGYATATDPEEALRQMGMEDVAGDPKLAKYLEDLPKFGMGYKQQIGDVMAGGRAGLMGISQQARTQQAQAGFAGGGAGAVGQAQARKGLERGVATGKRGIVESYQADLLSAIADIETKGGFEFGGYKPDWAQDAPVSNPNWSPPVGAEGATYNFEGANWVYQNGSWVTEEEQQQEGLYGQQAEQDYGP